MTEIFGEINPSFRLTCRTLLEGLNGGGNVGRLGLIKPGPTSGEGNLGGINLEFNLGLDLRGVS